MCLVIAAGTDSVPFHKMHNISMSHALSVGKVNFQWSCRVCVCALVQFGSFVIIETMETLTFGPITIKCNRFSFSGSSIIEMRKRMPSKILKCVCAKKQNVFHFFMSTHRYKVYLLVIMGLKHVHSSEPHLYTIYFMCNTLYYVLYMLCYVLCFNVMCGRRHLFTPKRRKPHTMQQHTFLLHFIVHTISNDIVFIIFKVFCFPFSLNTCRFFLT